MTEEDYGEYRKKELVAVGEPVGLLVVMRVLIGVAETTPNQLEAASGLDWDA